MRGEIALISTRYRHMTDNTKADNETLEIMRDIVTATDKVTDALPTGTILNVKSGTNDMAIPITIIGTADSILLNTHMGFAFGGVDWRLEIITSNEFLRRVHTATYSGSTEPWIARMDMNVEDGIDEQVFNALDSMINSLEMDMTSRYEARIVMQEAETIMYVLGGGISAILGFIGIFNFINVMSVGVMTRKREFATLESIGMSKKQMRSMLRNEGLGYAVITILFAITLGNAITYGLFLLFKRTVDYAEFTYPVVQCATVFVIITVICLATSEIVYKGISRATLVERLREAE